MGRFRRNNLIFITWIGDHGPRHVHVFDTNGLIVKWDLENDRLLEGAASARVLRCIRELQAEGKLYQP